MNALTLRLVLREDGTAELHHGAGAPEAFPSLAIAARAAAHTLALLAERLDAHPGPEHEAIGALHREACTVFGGGSA